MSYVSLARKYRPRRFVDMVGQESTTLALTNAIRLRREPHSVIFTGVRGIGKTTSARIYAKALNCEQGPTAEPCDVCASCVAIAAGHHEDVLEIDGASNTGVDDVRALQETLSYVPQRSTYKIYIIDEVHMLSISAFNALLKTLEEPPQHVVFIFATTELQKVPETIQSRCQVFHLQKISRPVIAERVRSILTAEGIAFDETALAIVAREGRGSMRDALTMLDQAIAVGGGQVSMEALRNMVGGSQALPVLELLDGLLRKEPRQILEVIARWDQEGLAISNLVEETAKACRNAFILRDLKGQAIDLQLLELEDREQQMLLELGEKAAPMDLNRLFRQLAKCLDDLRHADLDRFVLENYCLEWCFDPGLPDLQALMNLISGGQPMPQAAPRVNAPVAPAPEGPAINLRDRWKSSGPASASSRPSPASQAAAEPPRPAAAPAMPAQSAQAAAPLAKAAPSPQAGPGAMPQPSAGGQPLGNLLKTAVSKPTAEPVPQPSVTSKPLPQPQAMAQQAAMSQAPAMTQSTAKPQPSTAVQPAAMPQSSAAAQPAVDMMKTVLPQSEVTGTRPQAPLQTGPVRTGAINQPFAPAPNSVKSAPVRPDPVMPPMDQADDETPPWVLQEEAVRQGAVAVSQDEPIVPESPKNEGFLKQMARRATENAPVAPPNVETPTPPPAAASEPVWPENWRSFVDEWKKQKPLQGRVLEEAYILEYSPKRIRLAVEPTSMAGGKLLQQDVRRRLMEQFTQLFGFQGVLEAVPKADAHPGKPGTDSQPADLGETLLEVKQREREVAREHLRHRLEEHPMTREVISRFGGTIEQIELQ